MSSSTLPFELDRDETRGFHVPAREIHGTVAIEPDALVLVFRVETDDGEAGAHGEAGTAGEAGRAGAPGHVVRIPMADLAKVELTGGAVKSPRLVVEVAHEESLKDVPWAEGTLFVVRFRRADAVRAQDLVTDLEVRIAELK